MRTRHFASIAGLAVFGAVLATLPHWLTGNARWAQDYDRFAFYLPLGAIAYHNHPHRLADPTTGGRTYFQPLEIVPGVLAARGVGAGTERIGLCWRVLGGLAIGVGWWSVLRTHIGPAATVAAGCVLMADPGVVYLRSPDCRNVLQSARWALLVAHCRPKSTADATERFYVEMARLEDGLK